MTAGPTIAADAGSRAGHTAIVTGANHGIGAATAVALAARGCAVLCTFWRVRDAVDPGIPQAYRDRRAGGADASGAVRPRRTGPRPGRHPREQRHWLACGHVRGTGCRPARALAPPGQRGFLAAAVRRR